MTHKYTTDHRTKGTLDFSVLAGSLILIIRQKKDR
jgi:hypothetical protein